MSYEVSVRPSAAQEGDVPLSSVCDDLPQALDDLSRIVPAPVMDRLRRALEEEATVEITDSGVFVKEWYDGFLWRLFIGFEVDGAGVVSVASVAVNPP